MEILFNHQEVEKKWFEHWTTHHLFESKPNPDQESFTLILPPPNVTGKLHIGHALNGTYQDALFRYNKMMGKNAIWVPGTDHAGIATQNIVIKKLVQNGIDPDSLTKDQLLQEIEKVKDENHSIIVNQLKKLGVSCDWTREQYTRSPKFNKLVTETYQTLFNKSMIYEEYKPVNWCPRCQTALSNDEVSTKEHSSKLYYLKYKFLDSEEYITVATTRPETIFGDVAVAYHPSDPRRDFFQTQGHVLVPIININKKIPLIESSLVKPDFGTGLVKITPAHSELDFEIFQKNKNLLSDFQFILDKTGKLQNVPERYQGMDRFQGRREILKELTELNLLEKVENHTNMIGHCYRCQTVLEMYLSSQLFVKMSQMADKALEAMGQINIYPEHQNKLYQNWLTEIRDWCISRQIAWGHPIPSQTCLDCGHQQLINTDSDSNSNTCSQCQGTPLVENKDVLDTWFSSCLWAFGIFDSPEELEYYYPIDVLVTGGDILFFWVIRMIMMSLEMGHQIPFKNIYLHGIIRTKENKKMSKSLDNSINPIEIIDKLGADACRYTLMMATPYRLDAKIDHDTFSLGRGFCVKLWNSARYILMNLGEPKPTQKLNLELSPEEFKPMDLWIMYRLQDVIEKVNHCFSENYNFAEASSVIYDFYWNYFCNQYLEFKKFTIQEEKTQKILLKIVITTLRLLHPLIPFVTEEIYEHFKPYLELDETKCLLELKYPQVELSFHKMHSTECQVVYDLVTKLRDFKLSYQINVKEPHLKVNLIKNPQTQPDLLEVADYYCKEIIGMAKLNDFQVTSKSNLKTLKLKDLNLELEIEVDCPLNLEKKKQTLEKKLGSTEKSLKSSTELHQKLKEGGKPLERIEKTLKGLQDQKSALDQQLKELKDLDLLQPSQ